MEQVYLDLAQHLEGLVMGFAQSPELPALLAEMFTPEQARVALAIPAGGVPPLEAAGIAPEEGLGQAVANLQQAVAHPAAGQRGAVDQAAGGQVVQVVEGVALLDHQPSLHHPALALGHRPDEGVQGAYVVLGGQLGGQT